MKYRIIIPKIVQKQLKKLPVNVYERIVGKITLLASEPRPTKVKKLKGFENEYRIRVGDYRVRYEINDKELTIIILSCQHRRESYRD